MRNLTKFNSSSNIMQQLNNLQTQKMQTELLISKLKLQAENLGI